MNSRYLEIDSTYRDRKKFPDPAEFEIPISQTGRKGRDDALDPVCLSTPITQWTSNFFDITAPASNLITGTVYEVPATDPATTASDMQTLLLILDSGLEFQQLTNYYINTTLQVDNTTTQNSRRIISFQYAGPDTGGLDRAFVTLLTPLNDSMFIPGGTVTFSIYDPSDFTNLNYPLLFVPAGYVQQNAYNNLYIYNETLKQYRSITGYNEFTHLLTMDAVNNPVTGWTVTDDYSIRKDLPLASLAVTAPNLTLNTITITNGPLTAPGQPITPFINYYKNNFIRILPISGYIYDDTSPPPPNEITQIVSYDSSTQVATVYPPFTVLPTIGEFFEILPFSYDNLNPFVYSGSLVSQQEMVCYEVSLSNIILPNIVLNSGRGGRLAFYKYIYVELSNVSAAGAGLTNIIYSNNPNAVKMTFRIPITDINQPLSTPFIKLYGNDMTQTIKFRPNDTLFFKVTLPNGELIDTVITDTYSPYPPNYQVQISAIFKLKRL